MRICLRSLVGAEWQGGQAYIQNLAAAIASVPPEKQGDITVSVEMRHPTAEAIEALESVGAKVFVSRRLGSGIRGWAKNARRLPLPSKLMNPRAFDFIYPELAGPRVPYRWAAWIPDLQEVHLPELFPEKELERRRARTERIVAQAPTVVLSSGAARADLVNQHPDVAQRVRVLHFASTVDQRVFGGDPSEVLARYGLPERFFLVSNQLWVHKNHLLVAEALAGLAEGGQAPTVVCTGGTFEPRSPGYRDLVASTLRSLGITDRFLLLGLIPRVDQLQLMRACVAVIQPSRFEGWSTVVEDARALGKPILLSDIPVHREQDPPDARYFPPSDAQALARLMTDARADPPGPDLDREARARTVTAERVRAFGAAFLEIARED